MRTDGFLLIEILFLGFFNLVSPEIVFAVSVSDPSNFPPQVEIGQNFSVEGTLSGDGPGEAYYLKCRIGESVSELTEAQTFNSDSNNWLFDSSAWKDMPRLELTGDSANFSLECRIKAGVSSGQKYFYLRACFREPDESCGNYVQSGFGQTILVVDPPAPTLTPTPTTTKIPDLTATPTSTPTITPTSNPTQVPASYSNLFLSEFLPNPTSGNEWVEIYNGNSSEVDLTGWYLDDIAGGGEEPIRISGTIPGKSYRVFNLKDFYLNNSGDDVRLLDGGKIEKDKKNYSQTQKDKSWSKDSSGTWCLTDPTPGSTNNSCPIPSPTPTAKVSPTPSPTPSFGPSITATESASVDLLPLGMGEESSGKNSVLGENISLGDSPNRGERLKTLMSIFIVSGILLLGGAGYFLYKGKFR